LISYNRRVIDDEVFLLLVLIEKTRLGKNNLHLLFSIAHPTTLATFASFAFIARI
jgi:hypothetical protein